jgi:HAMP domain-containing protein
VRRVPLPLKLLTSYVIVVALVVVPLLWVLRSTLTASLEQTETEELFARASTLQQRFAAAPREAWPGLARDSGALLGARVTVIDSGGAVLADSELSDAQVATAPNHRDRPEVALALSAGQGSAVRHSDSLNVELIYAARRFDVPEGPPAVIRLAARRSAVAATVDAALTALRLGAAFAMTLAILFSLVAVFYVANPLRSMARAAVEFSAGNWRGFEVPRTRDELEDLGHAFEELGKRVRTQLVSIGAQEAMLVQAFELLPHPLLVIDADGATIALNSALRRALSLHPQDEERLTRELHQALPKTSDGAVLELKVMGHDVRAWPLARADERKWWMASVSAPRTTASDDVELAGQRLASIEAWFTEAAAKPQLASELATLRRLFDDLEAYLDVPPSLKVQSTPLSELLGRARALACAGVGTSVDRVVLEDVPQTPIAESLPGTARLVRELFGVGLRCADAGKSVPVHLELEASHVSLEVRIRESVDLRRVQRAARTGGAELAVITVAGEPSLRVRLLRA